MIIPTGAFSTLFREGRQVNWESVKDFTNNLNVEVTCWGERIVVAEDDSVMNLDDFSRFIFNPAFSLVVTDRITLADRVQLLDIGDAIIRFYERSDRMIERLSCCESIFYRIGIWFEKTFSETLSIPKSFVKNAALTFVYGSFQRELPAATADASSSYSLRGYTYDLSLAREEDIRRAYTR